jgi:hypothetical protein
MPIWKVYDEETASELKSRISGNPEVLVEERPAVLDARDAVILTPTAHKGVTMLITVRRKPETISEQLPAFETAPSVEPIEEPAPAQWVDETPSMSATEEEFFGPTTWERVEQQDPADFAFESREVAEQISEEYVEPEMAPEEAVEPDYAPPISYTEVVEPEPIQQIAPPVKETRERHYVATGFLGLDETVEDDEDLARAKRPWWKKLFVD